jgi:hypothetical protein
MWTDKNFSPDQLTGYRRKKESGFFQRRRHVVSGYISDLASWVLDTQQG